MRLINKNFCVAMMLCAIAGLSIAPASIGGTVAAVCDCGTPSCQGGCESSCNPCRRTKRRRRCPKCQLDVCTLDVKKSEKSKTCFKVEQKKICIPPVRFPWQKNCPPTCGKSKTVNVLKKHKYKCPSCDYKWSVQEPELTFSQPEPAVAPPTPTQAVEAEQIESLDPEMAPSETYTPPVTPVPAQPPLEVTPSSEPWK